MPVVRRNSGGMTSHRLTLQLSTFSGVASARATTELKITEAWRVNVKDNITRTTQLFGKVHKADYRVRTQYGVCIANRLQTCHQQIVRLVVLVSRTPPDYSAILSRVHC